MLSNQEWKASTKTGGKALTVKFGHIVNTARRDYIGTTRMILIPYTSSKKQAVLMRLVNICTQQKKIGTVTTTTGGTVSMTRVGLRAITATT